MSLGLDSNASPGPALLSPAPRSRQAGLGWSLLGLYKACKLTLCGENTGAWTRGGGVERGGGRRLERILAIPSPVEATESQSRTPGSSGFWAGARPLGGMVGAGIPKHGQEADLSCTPAGVLPPTHDCYRPNVTQFPPGPSLGLKHWPSPRRRKRRRRQSAPPQPASPQEGGGGGRGDGPPEDVRSWLRPPAPSVVPIRPLPPA